MPFTFADDDRVLAAGVNPNVVHQPNITFDKFSTMKNELIKDHGDMYVNFKKSGHHEEMYSFCKGKWIAFQFFFSVGRSQGTLPPPSPVVCILWYIVECCGGPINVVRCRRTIAV